MLAVGVLQRTGLLTQFTQFQVTVGAMMVGAAILELRLDHDNYPDGYLKLVFFGNLRFGLYALATLPVYLTAYGLTSML